MEMNVAVLCAPTDVESNLLLFLWGFFSMIIQRYSRIMPDYSNCRLMRGSWAHQECRAEVF